MATFCAAALESCPEGRVYIPVRLSTESERTQAIANLLAEGLSIRAIARQLKCDRREVREVVRVGAKPAFSAPTP
jgi:DNA-binding NarL/FixJ family response regulator